MGKKIIELLGDLLEWLFVPNENYFNNQIESIKGQIAKKIPYEDYVSLFETIQTVSNGEDITIDMPSYQIANGVTIQKSKFIDFGNITKYKNTWYGWVRGFTFIFLIIYNINQITKFLRGFSVADGGNHLNNNEGGKK